MYVHNAQFVLTFFKFLKQLHAYGGLWRKSRNLNLRLAFAYGALFEALFMQGKNLGIKWKSLLKTHIPFAKSQASDFRRLYRELGVYKRLMYLDCPLKQLTENCTGISNYLRTHPTVAEYWQMEPEQTECCLTY